MVTLYKTNILDLNRFSYISKTKIIKTTYHPRLTISKSYFYHQIWQEFHPSWLNTKREQSKKTFDKSDIYISVIFLLWKQFKNASQIILMNKCCKDNFEFILRIKNFPWLNKEKWFSYTHESWFFNKAILKVHITVGTTWILSSLTPTPAKKTKLGVNDAWMDITHNNSKNYLMLIYYGPT